MRVVDQEIVVLEDQQAELLRQLAIVQQQIAAAQAKRVSLEAQPSAAYDDTASSVACPNQPGHYCFRTRSLLLGSGIRLLSLHDGSWLLYVVSQQRCIVEESCSFVSVLAKACDLNVSDPDCAACARQHLPCWQMTCSCCMPATAVPNPARTA